MSIVSDGFDWVTTAGSSILDIYGKYVQTRNSSKENSYAQQIALEELSYKKAQERRAAEEAAKERTAMLANNSELMTVFKWLGGAVAATLVGIMVNSVFNTIRKGKKKG